MPCCGSINATPAPSAPGNRLDRELRHVPEKIDHPLGAGHNSGQSAEPRIQFGLVCFPLVRGEFGL